MIFNLFLIVFWFLTLVSPVGDYHKYLKSLSLPDTRTTLPDKYGEVVLVSQSIPSIPPPAPFPRFSPFVVPVYGPVGAKKSKSTRFGRSKRIFAIRKWVHVLFSYFTDIVGRPRPTRTTHVPTKVFVPVHPAPPTSGRQEGTPARLSATSTFDLVALWNTYKLVVCWIAATFSVTTLTFIRFLSCPRLESTNTLGFIDLSEDIDSSSHDSETTLCTSVPSSPFNSYGSLVDIYCSLGFPPVAPEDVPLPDMNADELLELADSAGSAPADVTSAHTAWIDAKTGDVGNTSTNGTSVGGISLEPAISLGSISGIVGLYAGEHSPVITPSSSRVGRSRSASGSLDFADRFPPTGQVHTPRTKLWLERLIVRVRDMERRGNHYGRVYDGWSDNPDLETRVEESRHGEDPVDSDGHPDIPVHEPTGIDSVPTHSDLSSVVQEVFSAYGSVTDLSTVDSRDSLDAQLGNLLDLQPQMTDSHSSGVVFDPAPVSALRIVPRHLIGVADAGTGVEVGSVAEYPLRVNQDPAGIPLPPSPFVGLQDLLLQLESEVDLLLFGGGIGPNDIPLPPSLIVEED